MVTDTVPSSGKGVRYGVFDRSGVTAVVVEALLGVGGFDLYRGAETTMVNTDIDVQKVTWQGLLSWELRNSCSRWPMNRLA